MGIIKLKGDLSDYINQYITNWSLNDDVSDKIDQLSITFAADRIASLPPFGTQYEVFIHGVSRSTWEVIGTTIDLDEVMSLTLSPVSKQTNVKEKKTQSFNDLTLGEIIKAVIEPCGYSTSITPSLDSMKVTSEYRKDESAGDFLNRLADDYGAVSKPYGKVWLFKAKNDTTNDQGKQKPTITITDDTLVISAKFTRKGKDEFKGVTVEYVEFDSKERKKISKGSAPFKNIGLQSPDKAKEVMASWQQYVKSDAETLTVTLPTESEDTGKAFAQGVLAFNRGRFIKGDFIIKSVKMNQNTTTITANRPK